MTVRTRFAPSPTGFLHVGGVRTALFAWLLARQNHGQFVLRLEDTDKQREVEGSAKHIIDSLNALELNHDEGPDIGGPYGPYKQSERLGIYDEWAKKLVSSGRAYADPYSPEELSKFRDTAKQNKKPFLFRDYRPQEFIQWDKSKPLRFKSEPKDYSWHDEVLGDLNSGPEVVDDFILIKSDGYPTYNFAHIIDDYLMKITHVIRSQEFTASVPRFLNLYEALEIERPLFATVPFVMGPDGKKKLSKRDGAKDVKDYIKEGYLAEALDNFIATLGWNDGTEQEIFSLNELISKFSLGKVQRSGAKFDEKRLEWMDGYHIRKLDLSKLYELSNSFWPEESNQYDDQYKMKVLGLMQERLKFLSELRSLTVFFFTDLPVDLELISNNKQLQKLDKSEIIALLRKSREALDLSNFDLEDLTERLNNLLSDTEQKPAVLFSLIRIATTQAPSSPGLADTLALLGKSVCIKRIDLTLEALKA
jgi:glutamyl-tRNA synthetase